MLSCRPRCGSSPPAWTRAAHRTRATGGRSKAATGTGSRSATVLPGRTGVELSTDSPPRSDEPLTYRNLAINNRTGPNTEHRVHKGLIRVGADHVHDMSIVQQ